jgi:hypothetical protein
VTDWYIGLYKVTLASLRGGAKVIVVRTSFDNKYVNHYTDIAGFEDWVATIKEIENGSKAKTEEED